MPRTVADTSYQYADTQDEQRASIHIYRIPGMYTYILLIITKPNIASAPTIVSVLGMIIIIDRNRRQNVSC